MPRGGPRPGAGRKKNDEKRDGDDESKKRKQSKPMKPEELAAKRSRLDEVMLLELNEHDVAGNKIKAILVDVFGTAVDWRASVGKRFEDFVKEAYKEDKTFKPLEPAALEEFADEWRASQTELIEKIRKGELPWIPFDQVARQTLDNIIEKYVKSDEKNIKNDEQLLRKLASIWHRLAPWNDTPDALNRLRKKYILGAVSNASISTILGLSKRGNISWDFIGGSDLVKQYLPSPNVFMCTAEYLGLKPHEILFASSHNSDLAVAKAAGLKTAFVKRLKEYGAGKLTPDSEPTDKWDIISDDLLTLTRSLQA